MNIYVVLLRNGELWTRRIGLFKWNHSHKPLEYDSVHSSQSSNHRSHSMNRNPNTALWRFQYRSSEIWIRNRTSSISHTFITDYRSSMIRPPNRIFLKIQVWIRFLNYSLTSGILFCSWTQLLEFSLAYLSLFLIIYL